MPRSVNAVASRARRKKVLKAAKGYFGARSKVYTVAVNAVEKGLQYAYRDRKNKKRAFRRLWIARINAATRMYGMSYSKFIHALTTKEIGLNRKVLADLAMNHPESFKAVINSVNLSQDLKNNKRGFHFIMGSLFFYLILQQQLDLYFIFYVFINYFEINLTDIVRTFALI